MKQALEEAAYDYAAQKTKFRKDVLKEVDADDYISRHSDCMEDFQCGVQWQAKQSPWISVKERLPEELESVLVLSNYEGKYLYEVAFIMNGKWICHNNKPAYWTPIPSFDEILEANKDVLERIKQKGD